jgi:hypothetical protein
MVFTLVEKGELHSLGIYLPFYHIAAERLQFSYGYHVAKYEVPAILPESDILGHNGFIVFEPGAYDGVGIVGIRLKIHTFQHIRFHPVITVTMDGILSRGRFHSPAPTVCLAAVLLVTQNPHLTAALREFFQHLLQDFH